MIGTHWTRPLLALGVIVAIGTSGAAIYRAQRFGESAMTAVCDGGDRALRRVELIFGLSRQGQTDVTETEWSNFLARDVTPRFPDGFTVLAANGQWRNSRGVVVREPSRVLLVWTPSAPDLDSRIEQIRSAWKQEQRQESVLRAMVSGCVSF